MADRTVLVVLHRQDRRTGAAGLRRDPGLAVIAIDGGEPAVAWARPARPALVVAELDRPAGDGARLVEALRAHPESRDIPVVAIGRAGLADHDAARTAGCAAFLAEPFDAADLARLVDDCLSARTGTPRPRGRVDRRRARTSLAPAE